MSRSYWRYIAAIAGLIFTTLLCYGVYEVWEYEQQPYAVEKYQPARDARLRMSMKDAKVTSPTYQPHCEAPQTKDDADLCSQWEMVQSSEEGNRLVRVAIGLGFLEFIGLVTSLVFTGWAAIAASNGTRAANKAIQQSERFSKQQLRAYVSAQPFDGKMDGLWPNFDLCIKIAMKNSGQTPAYKIWTEFCIAVTPYPIPDGYEYRMTNTPIRNNGTVCPGEQENAFVEWPRIPPDIVDDCMNGRGRRFVVFGTVHYTDAFGDDQFTNMSHVLFWDRTGNIMGLYTERHNDSS